MRFSRLPAFSVALGAILILNASVRAEAVSFRNEIMAVLSRAGCNQGACHGNQNGKGGFKLSLRGEDPDFDFAALTRDMLGRRADPHRPADSLLLQKATMAVAHEGGMRFNRHSLEYDRLSRWIADGMKPDPAGTPTLKHIAVAPAAQVLVEPADHARIQVRAAFSDGSTRDVTRLAVYEPSGMAASVDADGEARRQQFGETAILVRYLNQRAIVQLAFVPARPGYAWKDVPENNFVDRHVFAKLRGLRMLPSELCTDSVFLRRAYLDLLGISPTPDEVRVFLSDAKPDKRSRLIDRLLDRPEFVDFWALKWSDVLRNEEKVLDRKGVQAFHQWVRRSIADGQPLNEFARELIAARGSTYERPAANFYRALRDPQTRAEAAAQVFLGIRLQCAKCHNHPFDQWTQNDYHGLAAFFARIDYRIVSNRRADRLDKHEFDGEQIVLTLREGEWLHPRGGEALRPLFLGAATPTFPADADRLQALADWVARPDNPFFARTQVNRVWFHLMGRGLVEPNDDFRASNPPVNGPLLEALSRDFVAHRFDLRHAIRTIMNSRVYQLSALANDTNRDDENNFSHGTIRPLQAEQLLDSFARVIGKPVKFNGQPLGLRAAQLPGVPMARRESPTPGEKFLKVFGKPERLLSCECERSDTTTLNQAFQLLTGELVNGLLSEPDNRIGKLLAAQKTDREIIAEFYLAALCRPPSAKELDATVALVAKAKDRRAGLEDVVWGLVNAKEFLLRR